MSTRYESAGAKDTRVTVLKAGEEIGDDVVGEGNLALVFSYDEVFYMEGPAHDLRMLLTEAMNAVNGADYP